VRLIAPPSESGYAIPIRRYRVTFWQQQVPEPGSAYTAEEMGWSADHFDFADVDDVHEVIEWAEVHFDEYTRADSARGYVLAAWTPDGLLDEPLPIQIAGWDPTVEGAQYNLHRPHPLRPS
jgi:hypothetical protein